MYKIFLIFGFLFLGLSQIQQSYIKSYNVNEKYVEIEFVDGFYSYPTDTVCQIAAEIMHSICKQGYTLYVIPNKDGFSFSRTNPMTSDWTKTLVKEDL